MFSHGATGAGGDNKSAMGVLHTGYLDKYNPANRRTKKRFVVLTHVGLHWFKRETGYDLFGEERGCLNVTEIYKCFASADTLNSFEVATREEKRVFTAASKEEAAAWLNAINTAMRNRSLYRRETLNNLSFLNGGDDAVPNCVMATLKGADGTEVVVERSLVYGKKFTVPVNGPDDTVTVVLSNGTSAEVTMKILSSKPIGENFPVRVETDAHVANLLFVVEASEQVKRKKGADTAMGNKKVTLLTLAVDDYAIQKRDGNGGDDDDMSDIPKRFIDGCFGDMVEAERRWRLTKQWRVDFGTDQLLEQEHPYFDDIKKALPAYYCYSGYDGNPVYYERSGRTDLPLARAIGIDWLVWHYVYTTEFLYSKLHPRESAKTITIFDVDGMGLKDVAGEPFEFIRRASHVMQEHYPERCRVIIIANAPGWFSFVWKMIRPLVNEATQKKIRITKAGDETFRAISEFVDPKYIPTDYGGTLTCGSEPDSCRWNSPEEKALREHVYEVNKRYAAERKKRGEAPPPKYTPPSNIEAMHKHK